MVNRGNQVLRGKCKMKSKPLIEREPLKAGDKKRFYWVSQGGKEEGCI